MSPSAEITEDLVALPRPLLLALDVDGTVAPIVRDPDKSAIPATTLSVLQSLASAPDLQLALITGRDLQSLQRMEALEGIWRGVEHGGLVLAPGQTTDDRTLPGDKQAALDRFRAWVEEHASDAFVEFKPQAVAVHVRGIAERDTIRAERLLQEADAVAQSLGLHVRRGRALREAEAVRHDKGTALRDIFARSKAGSVFFAGDDITDFPAIEFAASNGIGVFVRSDEQPEGPGAPARVVDNVDEISAVLADLAKAW